MGVFRDSFIARERATTWCVVITHGGYSHAYNTSAKQANLLWLV